MRDGTRCVAFALTWSVRRGGRGEGSAVEASLKSDDPVSVLLHAVQPGQFESAFVGLGTTVTEESLAEAAHEEQHVLR